MPNRVPDQVTPADLAQVRSPGSLELEPDTTRAVPALAGAGPIGPVQVHGPREQSANVRGRVSVVKSLRREMSARGLAVPEWSA
jgi:hypothetical protein